MAVYDSPRSYDSPKAYSGERLPKLYKSTISFDRSATPSDFSSYLRSDSSTRDVELGFGQSVEKLAPSLKRKSSQLSLFKPKTIKFWLILLSNFLALFLVALDRTIVATAVPRITDEFHSLGDIGWYGSVYMLTTSASQLLFGRIYKFYSMKKSVLPVSRHPEAPSTVGASNNTTGLSCSVLSSSKSGRPYVALRQTRSSSSSVAQWPEWPRPVSSPAVCLS